MTIDKYKIDFIIEVAKAIKFVKHIEDHLKDMHKNGVELKHYKPCCKICLKTIDEIYEEND